MGPQNLLPLQIRTDLGILAMDRYFTLPGNGTSPPFDAVLSHTQDTPFWVAEVRTPL